MTRPAAIAWSSGKDSAYALHEIRRAGCLEPRVLLTTLNEDHDRVAMHGVRRDILDAQARALGLPLIVVPLPDPCSNEVYEARMRTALDRLAAEGIHDIVFGDLFLADIRAYRERQLDGTGISPHFPLWLRNTHALARDMIAAGLEVFVATLDPAKVPPELAGSRFDEAFLAALPAGIDPCGENGEFHTVVAASPGFATPLALEAGITVERGGFLYRDFTLADSS